MSKKKDDALIGQHVQVRDTLLTAAGDAPHHAAGKVGQVLSRGTGGNYQVDFEGQMWVLHMDDFTVVDRPASASAMDVVAPAMAVPSLTNPRRRKGLDMDSIAGLAANIKVHGLGQPILVRPLPAARLEETSHLDPRPAYEIIAGERRWRACQLAGLPTMHMFVRDMTDQAAYEMQLVENIDREDLDPMEEAEGFDQLRTKYGYSVEQIAERIGRGKGESYVYKTLKLCALTPESREAMHEGPKGEKPVLGRSTGLLVARYAPALQPEVVAFIASQAKNGEPMPYREIAPLVYRRFNLVLLRAPFDHSDENLVPGCGSCDACPKRTGAQPDIFGDGEAEDSCTDPDCFEGKRQAHIAQVKARAQQDGFKVIDGDEALRAKASPHQHGLAGYVRLTDVAYTQKGNDNVEREVTFEDALRSQGKKAPKPQVFIDPHSGKAEKVITAELRDKLIPPDPQEPKGGAGVQARLPAAKHYGMTPNPEDGRPEAEQAIGNHHVERAVTLRIFDAIRNRSRTDAEVRVIAEALFINDVEATSRAEEYLGWYADLEDLSGPDQAALLRERIAALPAADLAAAVVIGAVDIVLGTWLTTDAQAVALAQSFGVDVLAVRDKVAEDLDKPAAGAGDDQADEE